MAALIVVRLFVQGARHDEVVRPDDFAP